MMPLPLAHHKGLDHCARDAVYFASRAASIRIRELRSSWRHAQYNENGACSHLHLQPGHVGSPGRRGQRVSPLNLEPEVERQIERVLILADEPVLKRRLRSTSYSWHYPQRVNATRRFARK